MSTTITSVDALANAIRDTLCQPVENGGLGLAEGIECDVTPDGRPNPDCGERFVAIHSFSLSNSSKQCLDERYNFKITVTVKTSAEPYDRKRDGHAWALALPIRAAVHMSYVMVNLATTYDTNGVQWVEPMMFSGGGPPKPEGPDWFWAEATGDGGDPTGIVIEMSFQNARRVQALDNNGEGNIED